MKKIFRTFAFSGIALYFTSLWNHGLQVQKEPVIFLEFALAFTLVALFIKPILKLILFPINFLTLGLVGTLVNLLLFYFLFSLFPELKILAWDFPGAKFGIVQIPGFHLSSFLNFIVVIFSISFLISLFENFL